MTAPGLRLLFWSHSGLVLKVTAGGMGLQGAGSVLQSSVPMLSWQLEGLGGCAHSGPVPSLLQDSVSIRQTGTLILLLEAQLLTLIST